MPRAGMVVVGISPVDARLIATWLRALPPALWSGPRINAPTLSNGVRTELVERFEAIGRRKRAKGQLADVEIELDRQDAIWFAAKVSGGMMFGGYRGHLPGYARAFCDDCRVALLKKKGRRRLHGAALAESAERTHLDDRHRKRLRARERSEQTDAEFWASWRGLGEILSGRPRGS